MRRTKVGSKQWKTQARKVHYLIFLETSRYWNKVSEKNAFDRAVFYELLKCIDELDTLLELAQFSMEYYQDTYQQVLQFLEDLTLKNRMLEMITEKFGAQSFFYQGA